MSTYSLCTLGSSNESLESACLTESSQCAILLGKSSALVPGAVFSAWKNYAIIIIPQVGILFLTISKRS